MSISGKGTTFAGVVLDPTFGIGRNTTLPSNTACTQIGWFFRLGTGFEGFGGHQTLLCIRSTASGATARLAVDPSTHNIEVNVSGTITSTSTNFPTSAGHWGALTLDATHLTAYWDGVQIAQVANPFGSALDGLIWGNDHNDGNVYTDAFDGEFAYGKVLSAALNATQIAAENASATVVDTGDGYALYVFAAAASDTADTFSTHTATATGAIIDGTNNPTFGVASHPNGIFFGAGV